MSVRDFDVRVALHSSSGFNPCFSGCRSAIFNMLYVFTPIKCVSILVLVDVGPRLFK